MESLAKHFRGVTATIFSRYGFAYAELLTQWPAVAGEDIARHCEPERIKWPRSSQEKRGATLVLRAAPGRALDLQHETTHIAERINRFYGYEAIAAIKIIQAPLTAQPQAPLRMELDQDRAARLEARLHGIADPALQTALKRLGHGALAAHSRTVK
jgi:hypothetical protein